MIPGHNFARWPKVARALGVALLSSHLLAVCDAAAAEKTPSPPKAKRENTAATQSGFAVEPRPKWVSEVLRDSTPHIAHAAMHFALIDLQTRLGKEAVERYVHRIIEVNESAGLTMASQIRIDFDPLYQRLALHGIAIWRDGKRLDKLDRRQVNLLHRETQLEAQVYDGRVTASRVLDDLRVGDRIEWSYTLRGANPVFGDQFVDSEWSAARDGPIALFQYRLLAPEARRIAVKAMGDQYNISTQVQEGVRETLVRRRDVPQLESDTSVPASAYLPELVNLSEYTNWADVAHWAHELFAKDFASSPELLTEVENIRSSAATPLEQLRHALDFVQTQIRYFGTEIGEYSHQPAAPAKVLAQRFGDCKDKVTLLAAILRELGIKAQPVLVSTNYRESIASMTPSPLAFNHAIVRVELDGKTYWLDGTRAYQRGALDDRNVVGLGKALIAQPEGDAGLVDMPSSANELREVTDTTLRVITFPADPMLDVHIRYQGELAEIVRALLAIRPKEDIEKLTIGEYLRFFPGATKQGDLQIEEDPEHNAISVALHLNLPDYWRYPEQQRLAGNFYFVSLMETLRLTSQAPRTRAFLIAFPGIYRETFSFEFPEDVYLKTSSTHNDVQNKYLSYHYNQDATVRSNRFRAELQLPKSEIAAAEWNDYMSELTKLWSKLGGLAFVPAVDLPHIENWKERSKKLSEDMSSGKLKVFTSVQAKAQMSLLMFNAQLDSGRLSPKLRAQALVQRGTNYDYVGAPDSAREDFLSAVALDPTYAKGYEALAINAVITGHDSEVDSAVAKALELAPNETEPRYARLFSSYLRGSYQQAQDEALEILKNPTEADRSYAAIWLYLANRHLGGDGKGSIADHMPTSSSPGWPYPVLQMFAGTVNMDEAEKAASENGKVSPERLCELYFYAGEQALVDGSPRTARRRLQQSIDTKVVEFNEYGFAKRELKKLDSEKF